MTAMNSFLPFIEYSCEPLVRASKALAPVLAKICHWPLSQDAFTVADFAVSVGVIGFICIYWSCWMHARLGNYRIATRREKARDRATIDFQGMLMDQSREAIAVLSNATREPQFFSDAKMLFAACKEGPDAQNLADHLEALIGSGTPFATISHTPDNAKIEIRGKALGGRAVLYLRRKDSEEHNFQEVLDRLPLPIWLRDADMALTWANQDFLTVTGAEGLEAAVASNLLLNSSEASLFNTALKDNKSAQVTTPVILDGMNRTLKMHLIPLQDRVAGVAVDVTDIAKLEARLQCMTESNAEMMEQLPFALAIFDGEQRLASYNAAYARLWGLPDAWLDDKPTQDKILDRLRENRRLPEQRNFAAWKQDQVQIFVDADRKVEEFWHLPGGKSLRVLIQPHLQGGVFVLFEDVSEKLRLEESLAMLTQVQRATLNTLDEGIAIFGTDGRLVLHNDLFARMWLLTEEELAEKPHFAEIANICSQRIGRDGIWGIVSCGVNSAQPERLSEWGKAVRADGRTISLALARLPNGATSVTFTDLTDVERFSTFQNAGSYVAA